MNVTVEIGPVEAMHILSSAMQHVLRVTPDERWEAEGTEPFELLRAARETVHREMFPRSYERNYGRKA